jgi:hypothetical protein
MNKLQEKVAKVIEKAPDSTGWCVSIVVMICIMAAATYTIYG